MKKKWFKPFEEDPEEALEILPPNMADDDWNYLVNLWSNKDWKVLTTTYENYYLVKFYGELNFFNHVSLL